MLSVLTFQKKAMKKLFIVILFFTSNLLSAQTSADFLDHVAVVAGAGITYGLDKVYEDPTIREDSSLVVIERGPFYRTSATFGLVYSPFVYKVWTPGKSDTTYKAKGLSFGLFMSPSTLASLSSARFLENIDMGLGIGWKSQYFAAMFTLNNVSIKQPRAYFVNDYMDKHRQYIVNGQVQNSIDPNNSSIFYTKHLWSIGFQIVIDLRVLAGLSESNNKRAERLSLN
jgi:hypothetical protein